MTENVLEMINDIDNNLIERAMEEPKRKKNVLPFKKVKWTVLAACLALALAVPVVAETFRLKTEYNEEEEFWNVYTEEVVPYDSISDEVKEFTKNLHDGGYKDYNFMLFWNMNEVEEYIGITLPKNSLIPISPGAKTYFTVDGKIIDSGRYHVHVSDYGTGEVGKIHIEMHGRLSGGMESYDTTYEIVTDKHPNGRSETVFAKESRDHKDGELENFTNAAGIDYVILTKRNKTGRGLNGVTGFIVVDKVMITVDGRGYDKDDVYERVKSIMENFE